MEENTTDNFARYHAMRSEILNSLSRMAKICEKLDLKKRTESLMDSCRKLQEHRFSVGIVSELKRGKSTVINAMLGKELIPCGVVPSPGTINRITYGSNSHAQLLMWNGARKAIPVENLPKYLEGPGGNLAAMLYGIKEVVVYDPCCLCHSGVDIVETPCLNDTERKNQITESVIPKLDAVIMLLVADNPFSGSAADFFRDNLIHLGTERLIFLVNKIDTVRPKDRDKAINGIREKIKKTVLDKTEEEYGKESAQYRIAQEKLADIRIYPISALDALDGRLDGDEELLRKSGILEFEDGLSRMLTTCELSSPMMELIHTGMLVRKTIRKSRDLRRRAWTQLDDEDYRLLEKTACASKTILSHFSDVLT